MNPNPGAAAQPPADGASQVLASTPPDSQSKPRAALPDYELLHRIGAGAYGEVWLARNVLGKYRAAIVSQRAGDRRTNSPRRMPRGRTVVEDCSGPSPWLWTRPPRHQALEHPVRQRHA